VHVASLRELSVKFARLDLIFTPNMTFDELRDLLFNESFRNRSDSYTDRFCKNMIVFDTPFISDNYADKKRYPRYYNIKEVDKKAYRGVLRDTSRDI
jgi:hypothetical protein